MKNILIINHDRDCLAKDKNILARNGLRIFTACTAEEGLRIHREEKVSLILTELDLPDMEGDVLCSRIRQEQSLRKVSIIIVCRDTPEEIARAKNCGANAQLLIPITPEKITDCVGKYLDVPTRIDFRVLVRAQVYTERGASTLFGTSRNLSVSGLLVDSDDHLAVGDRVSCMFFLPGPREITAVGEVVRSTRQSRIMNQYGIRFISLYPQVHSDIEQFVAANALAA